PGMRAGFTGRSSGPYVAGVGRFASYAITSTEGHVEALSGRAWTDTEQRTNVALEPGASVTYERVFVVGERPDLASVVAELTKMTPDGQVGALEITLTDASGAPVRAAAGAKVVVGTESAPAVLTFIADEEGPRFGGELPPGTWLVGYAPSAGRLAAGPKAEVVVKPGATSRVSLAVTEPASLSLGPCEEAAAKNGPTRPIP